MANHALAAHKQREIEVDRNKLITILEENKAKHIANYQEALDGYKAMATEKLQQAYEQAKVTLEKNVQKGILSLEEFNPNDPMRTSDYLVLVEGINVQLKVPRNFSDEYDAAIAMAKWDVRDTLTLTYAEFQCFVRDIWDWSRDFFEVSALYKAKSI
jgi:hypothetical protein